MDPEREYGELVRALGGEVITISASDPNGCHINALDLSEGYGDGKEPLVMKSEFIMSLYEQLMGADKIEPQEKSIIDRSVGNIYREYLKNYQGEPPTLKNLYDDLMKQVNPEAHRIALALELFTVGTTDREQLARLLGASDTQMSYVDNAPAGHGLIKVGGAIVPISNELPKNTELYRLMSTKPGED